MSDPQETPPAPKAERRRRSFLGWTAVVLLVLLVLLGGLFAVGRWGVLSQPGRELVMTFVNGKKLGRYGRINVYGLKGDLWDDFFLERVTVTDAKGVWLDARDVRVDWNWLPLVIRKFKADNVSARSVRLIRRPELEPDLEPPKPMPLDVEIERIYADIELLEGFSREYGRWILTGETDLEREGKKEARVKAVSLSRKGDYLSLDALVEPRRAPRVAFIAYERQGGPIAGALGYSPDQPFVAAVRSGGRESAGRFGAVVRTGRFTPLRADGRWTDDFAQAQGYASLAGSTLLKPWADRFGAEAVFGLAGRKRQGDRFGMGLVVRADNLDVRASGLMNRKTWRSIGDVRLAASTPSLSRLAGTTLGDALSFRGAWRGDQRTWRLRGDAALTGAQVAGARLARLSGPVTIGHARGRWDFAGDLAGAGGAGDNAVSRLLGARPTAHIEVARLPDGRWLFERLRIDGAAGRVEGTGGRSLLGGLTFRGRADLTNIRMLRTGARGEVAGTFEADQSRPGQPWRLAFDARGRRFATGMGELDRLLGPEPRLAASGLLSEGRTAIENAVLTGKAGQASAKGLIEDGTRMRLALDWSAKGPFQAGPVEILGDARGTGALTGTFAEPKADLTARFDRIDLERLQLFKANVTLSFHSRNRAYDGRVAVTAGSNYGPAEARSAFRFMGDGVRLDELFVDAAGINAQGSLALQGRNPSSADLLFRLGPGAFVDAGFAGGRVKLTDGPADAAALIDVVAENLRLKGSAYQFRALRLSGQGTLSRLPFIVSADIRGAPPVKFEGEGVYARTRELQTFSLTGQGRLRRADFRTLQPIVFSIGQAGRRNASVDLGFGNGRLVGQATQTAAGFDARADLTGVDLGAIGEDFAGRVNGVLVMSGRGQQLTGSLDARLEDARSTDGPRNMDVDGTIKAVLTDERLRIEAAAFDEGGLRAETSLDLPAEASAAPLHLAVARTRPMSGSFSIKGEVKPVWDLLLGGDRSLAGQVDASGTLAGTINDPLIRGSGAVTNGRFDESGAGLALRNLSARMVFDRDAAVISEFSANDGRGGTPGTVSGQGRIEFRSGGASSFTLALDRFEVIDNDLARAQATGPIRIDRAADGRLRLSGDLLINEAEIAANPPTPSGVVLLEVTEINRPVRDDAFEEERRQRSRGAVVLLDVKLRAPRNVVLSGRGLNLEFALDAQVGGTSREPTLTGEARVRRGDYEFAGKRFTFDERGRVTLSTRPEDIRLDLRAIRDDPALTAVIRITGTAAKPQLALTSSPVLPQDEILAQILFGRSASQLSGPEAAQLASSVASLAGGGGLDVIGNIRELAGLDRLAFGSDQYGMTVAGGKYINENIYFEIIGGGREGQAVQVEWRVRRNLAIVSRVGGQGEAKLSIRWRRERR